MSSLANPPRTVNALKPPHQPQTASFSCFPVRALSTSEWRKGFTTPSPFSPNTSTPAPRDSALRWACDLHAEVFGGTATDLERIDRSQPALFTVEYALARLVDTYGVRAGAYIGYSTGEYIAATLAGVFDLETAIKTVSLRARLMHESPPGAMVAVAVGPDDIAQYLADRPKGVELSAVNDPGNCVVAGPKDQIRAFSQRLNEDGIPVRRVRATHAFHSSSMDPMLGEFQEFLSRQELRAPQHTVAEQPHRNLDVRASR